MAELYQGSLKKRIMLYPVQTIKEVAEDTQPEARGFWTEVEHPELGTSITYPGAFVKLAHNPLRIWRRAPLIGEHNREIYEGELDFSREELTILKQGGII
jgi:formyl-CoA transferase